MTNSISTLSALSPIDGRYASKTDLLRPWFSEAAFMHHRVKVEIHWLIALSQAKLADIPSFSSESEVKILKEKNVYEGNENYDSKIDHTSSCFGFYYKIQNGKVVLADSAIGIERKDLGTGTENKK